MIESYLLNDRISVTTHIRKFVVHISMKGAVLLIPFNIDGIHKQFIKIKIMIQIYNSIKILTPINVLTFLLK